MMSWPNGTTDLGAQYQRRSPRNSFFDAVRDSDWYRAQDRTIADVCSGIAAYRGWGLSPVCVLVVVATLCMPAVAIAYGLAWFLLPETADGRIHTGEVLKGRFDVAVIGGVFVVLAGLSSALSSAGTANGVGLGWFQSLVLMAAMTAIVIVIVNITRSTSQGSPHHHGAIPPYEVPQHDAPQYGNPQYSTRQQQASAMGVSVPFGHSAPGAKDTDSTMLQQQSAQIPEGFPAYDVPAGSAASAGTPHPDGATSAAQGTNAGLRSTAVRPTRSHAGWTTPSGAPRPRQWTLRPMSTRRPRIVSSRANLAITSLLILVAVAILANIYMIDKGPTVLFTAVQTTEQTITRIISIGGGVCLIVVDPSLAVAALRDCSADWLTALSIISLIFAISTVATGIEGAQRVNQHINMTMDDISKQMMLD